MDHCKSFIIHKASEYFSFSHKGKNCKMSDIAICICATVIKMIFISYCYGKMIFDNFGHFHLHLNSRNLKMINWLLSTNWSVWLAIDYLEVIDKSINRWLMDKSGTYINDIEIFVCHLSLDCRRPLSTSQFASKCQPRLLKLIPSNCYPREGGGGVHENLIIFFRFWSNSRHQYLANPLKCHWAPSFQRSNSCDSGNQRLPAVL